ncbi:MAG: amidohydrolase family protein [Lactovum sp.]
MKADKILRSQNIFTSLSNEPISGFIAISKNKIIAISNDLYKEKDYFDEKTEFIDLKDKLICPGFVDSHCFFTGYLLTQTGLDLSSLKSKNDIILAINHFLTNSSSSTVLAKNLNSRVQLTQEDLDQHFKSHSIILFKDGHETCLMNSIAQKTYSFTPETCWSESYWKLLRFLLSNKDYVKTEFQKYLSLLNSKGITSIKEMGFDDYYGFTSILKELENEKKLSARIHFMSQPVAFDLNLNYGKKMYKTFKSDFVKFSGYNQMTDGSISQFEGEMKEEYLIKNTHCLKEINWKKLESDVLEADKNNFRFSLHAQGDAAIEHSIRIFNQCKKDKNGKLINRHAITDLECADPIDFKLMGEIGLIAEIYPQIMSITNKEEKTSMINQHIGKERGKNYWNRREILNNHIILSCATDLPLVFDDIPESIYHSVGGYFPEGGEPFNPQNTITLSELLKAWTLGGQYNLSSEAKLGTLSVGKLADISVFDRNIFNTNLQEIRESTIVLTLVNGEIVYNNL